MQMITTIGLDIAKSVFQVLRLGSKAFVHDRGRGSKKRTQFLFASFRWWVKITTEHGIFYSVSQGAFQ
jgi:hypothetical protein